MPDVFLVFGHQNRFRPARIGQRTRCGFERGVRIGSREKQLESAATPGLAIHANESMASLNDAVNGRKSQSRALAYILSGEKRLENPPARFAIHSSTGVR